MNINIIKGRIECAKKVVIYGPEGIGKSTMASQFPQPVFIDCEGSTKELDVARYPPPRSFEDILAFMDDAVTNHTCKTLIIDTADWAEHLCTRYTCRRLNVKGIEDLGYGKGYTYQSEDFQQLLSKADMLIEHGINVVFIAHAVMRKFEQPDEMGAYDRWELKLAKRIAPLLKEWADMVLFVNYKTAVITDTKTNSKKATGGTRVMYTTHHPCWDAKNRFELAEELPASYDSIRHIFEASSSTNASINRLREMMAEADISEEQLKHLVASKGHYPETTAIGEYSADFIENWAIKHFNQIVKTIKEDI